MSEPHRISANLVNHVVMTGGSASAFLVPGVKRLDGTVEDFVVIALPLIDHARRRWSQIPVHKPLKNASKKTKSVYVIPLIDLKVLLKMAIDRKYHDNDVSWGWNSPEKVRSALLAVPCVMAGGRPSVEVACVIDVLRKFHAKKKTRSIAKQINTALLWLENQVKEHRLRWYPHMYDGL